MKKLQFAFVKSKGQASGEYVVIIAVAVVFVLAIVVTAGVFLQDPAKKATVEQGGLIQSEISSLSKSLDKARVVTMRSPVAYRGFIDASIRMRFDVGTCLKSAALHTNESGVFEEVSVLSNLQNAPVGRLLTFDHVFREGEARYNIRVCTCEDVCGWALQGPSPASGLPEEVFVSEFANREGNAQNGLDSAALVVAVPHGDYRYVEARDDFFDSNRPRGFRSLRVELLNAQLQQVNCNHGNCVYIANFTYNASGTYLKNATLKTLNANNELAEIQFSQFNQCAGVFVSNYSTRQVVDRQINYFERCLIAKDPASNDVNPLSTIENYNWTIELCNKYEKCKTPRQTLQIPRAEEQREEALREQQVEFSVIVNRISRVVAPDAGDEITFTINSNVDVEFRTTIVYAVRQDGNFEEQLVNIGMRRRGENRFLVPNWEPGRPPNYLVEICRNEQCVRSNN